MKKLYVLLLIALGAQFVTAQKYTAVPASSKLEVTGTSTLHDWECVAETFKGYVEATVENGAVTEIKDFAFGFDATSLKSHKSGMDKKTWEALKSDKHPKISFASQSVKIQGNKATFIGTMSIAGVSKTFEAPVTIAVTGNQIELTGKKSFKLAEFNIEPPTAMFGTIKTGEEVAIHYDIVLTKS